MSKKHQCKREPMYLNAEAIENQLPPNPLRLNKKRLFAADNLPKKWWYLSATLKCEVCHSFIMVKFLKITVINDNEGTKGLMNSWGWSALVESESWRMIFDAGPDPRILKNNSRTMGIDLNSISFGFMSHDHFDHSGGFAALVGLKVYVSDVSGYLKSVGIDQILVREPAKLADSIWSSGAMYNLSVIEHFAVINHKNFGNVMIVGCSHPGIDVMLERAEGIHGKIKMLLGGFHNPALSKMENVLKRCDTVLPSHCSGSKAKAMASTKSKYFEIRTGTTIAIDESGSLTHSYFVN